ncbi:Pre-mRNA-processing ATP-dependent RNA helicase PRP5 [Madurella mycetomatis]|uniref:Pre-mRNA-processing ATP-dependent RNA helicase PRP5 n=1 Tax=Madurella mycetomatis TaxID=100816 RepID=A0A175WHP0_9PEZI|nr:Pre-mRNA-processing ATP-dependent RNA helicase PRP5 [Madurella mycetomatis]
MATTEPRAEMEEPLVTVAGHATEGRTGCGRRIAVTSGAETATEITVVGGTTPATAGAAATILLIPLLGGPEVHSNRTA